MEQLRGPLTIPPPPPLIVQELDDQRQLFPWVKDNGCCGNHEAGLLDRPLSSMDESDIKKATEKTIDKAKELCNTKGFANVACEVLEGDARNVISEAVERHHASILAMGSHGYGAFKRAVLGSVSDYCSHHAHCSWDLSWLLKAKS
ncbi:hypothetical protein HAX54_025361 [Datura stramonium]|uniref:UspA domain-containing protein n=1 Tax=Datura stramonium TaxID=4076 RepID=A0ABS8S672_DATST|nr:hypothetical protein [Datura stramonium]